jgi:hypothetical protein
MIYEHGCADDLPIWLFVRFESDKVLTDVWNAVLKYAGQI